MKRTSPVFSNSPALRGDDLAGVDAVDEAPHYRN